MKTVVKARLLGTYADGSPQILPHHEVDIVCALCLDPVSMLEMATGVCTNCNEPWQESQSTAVHVTSTPLSGTIRV